MRRPLFTPAERIQGENMTASETAYALRNLITDDGSDGVDEWLRERVIVAMIQTLTVDLLAHNPPEHGTRSRNVVFGIGIGAVLTWRV